MFVWCWKWVSSSNYACTIIFSQIGCFHFCFSLQVVCNATIFMVVCMFVCMYACMHARCRIDFVLLWFEEKLVFRKRKTTNKVIARVEFGNWESEEPKHCCLKFKLKQKWEVLFLHIMTVIQ